MIPFKYKNRKIRSISLRNLKEQCSYFIRIIPKNNEFVPFQSKCSIITTNPTYEIGETDPELLNGFNNLPTCIFYA